MVKCSQRDVLLPKPRYLMRSWPVLLNKCF